MAILLNEQEIIKTRLLLSEQRSYNRLLKCCTTILDPKGIPCTPEASRAFSEEIELEFKTFKGAVVRTQLVSATNRREVERYKAQKAEILECSEAARKSLITLRGTLIAAKQEIEHKVVYEAIATEILSNPHLKPCGELQSDIGQLREEIVELEREDEASRLLLASRGERFRLIVDQLVVLWAESGEGGDEDDHRKGVASPSALSSSSTLQSAIHGSLGGKDRDDSDLDLADAPPDKGRDVVEKSIAVDSKGDRMDVS